MYATYHCIIDMNANQSKDQIYNIHRGHIGYMHMNAYKQEIRDFRYNMILHYKKRPNFFASQYIKQKKII